MEGQDLDVRTPTRPSSLGIDCKRKRGARAALEGPPLERLCNLDQDIELDSRAS